jgi:D-alanyl-D-alanine carboxypeptidase (penicillin-binding protein 5/6)
MKRLATLLIFALSLAPWWPAQAQSIVPRAPDLDSRGYILMDHHSGRILAALNEHEHLEPASITKLMTAYAAFRAIGSGQLKLTDTVPVSENAWRTPGSRMFIEVNTRVSTEELMQGMIVQSGNDASVAIAEYLGGTEATFAEVMNQHARELGMLNSQYRNSTGLPAKDHYTTAADIARLASAIIREFPEFYHWYSQREFTYNGITQKNRNALLWRDPSVDGMKTGMTDAAGYCLVSSAERDGMRLIAVVLGARSPTARSNDSQALLNYGFRFYETRLLYPAGDPVTAARVWKGQDESADLSVREDIYVTIPRGSYELLEPQVKLAGQLIAPVDPDDRLGTLRVNLAEETLAEANLFAVNAIDSGSLWQQARDSVLLWFE